MSLHVGRSVAVVTALTAVLLSTGCGDDSAASGELSCPGGGFASVSLGGTDTEQGRAMASDLLADIAFHTGIPAADWEADEYGKDRATWVLRAGGEVVAVAEAVHGELGWRAGTVRSCGPLPGPSS